MDYEQKYKEALKVIESLYNVVRYQSSSDALLASQTIEKAFPELKESEDERIRKELLEHCINRRDVKQICVDASDYRRWAAWLEKQGEQKAADKTGTKFKIEKGKWYVCIRNLYDNYANKAFCEGDTYLSTQDGSLIPSNSNVPFEVTCPDVYFRDWTIQDAKDGDILMANAPFIFNGNLEGGIGCPGAHCGINTLGKFQIPKYQEHWTGHTTTPATKEQRDFLFQKMKEAGYEWGADKNELKKIEPNPAWSEEDDKRLEGIIGILGNHSILVSWLKSLKERVQPQPKREWSEEDEKIIDEAVEKLEKYAEYVQGGNSKRYILDLASRVESLRPQPKQEWNVQDEDFLGDAIYAAKNTYSEKCGQEELIEWLKSFKPHNWKPSEEQMIDLYYAAMQLSVTRPHLQSLYNDLKNL